MDGSFEKLLLFAVLIALIAVLAASVVYLMGAGKRLAKAWQAFAHRVPTLQLQAGEPWPRLVGSYRGVNVSVRIIARGTSDSQSLHTVVAASCTRRLPNDFALKPQGIFALLEKAYGAQDVELGDPAFDRNFVIQGADESEARALLWDPALRQTLLAEAEREPALSVVGGQAVIENNGTVEKAAALQSMLDAATAAAQAVDAATACPAMQQHARTAGVAQAWMLERNQMRVFAAVMTIPVGFALALGAGALIPRPYGSLGWLGAVLAVAVAIKLLLPPRPRLQLDGEQLVLERGAECVVLPLRQCRWWCGPWHQSGYECGSLLHLEAGGSRLVIGGAQHVFDDPRWYQAAPAAHPDIIMLRRPFADLLNGLGYAMRRLSGHVERQLPGA